MTSPFRQAAAALIALGFSPIPLIPPSAPHSGKGKAPGEYKGGRWQGMTRWQRFRDVSPTSFELGLWSNQYPDANMGLVLGTSPKAGLHVVALDFDAEDPKALGDMLQAAPPSPMVKRGRKGETRFYLASRDFKTRAYNGTGNTRLLDVLTGFDTRQTVCPPSIHPDTLQPYVWSAGPVPAASLPVIDEAAMTRLEAAMAAHGWEPKPVARPIAPGPVRVAFSGAGDGGAFDDAKTMAMQNLDAWVPALNLFNLQRARGGYEAVATWRPSSTGRAAAKRKRNLSIQTNGIKDFGTNETYSPIDLVMAALDVSEAKALDWLEDRLGLSVVGITVADDFTAPGPRRETITIAPQPKESPVSLRPIPTGELDDALTRVPGLVGLITDWIAASARRPQRGLALGAALTVVGTAAGRKYAGPTRTGTHLYVLGLARTSAGKDHPLNCVARILNASNMTPHVGPSQFMSMSALIKCLNRQPLTLCSIDELGSFLARINGKRSSTHERAITGILRTAWGASFQTMAPPEWAGQVSQPIHAPALSIYGVSTHQEFFEALEGGDIFNGFLNRFLAFSTQIRPPEQDPEADAFDVPRDITDLMAAIYESGGPMANATLHSSGAEGPLFVVPWDGGPGSPAHLFYKDFARQIEAREDDHAFLARTVEMAQRLATIRAIGIDPIEPVLRLADMEWGASVALWSAETMKAQAGQYMSSNDWQANVQAVQRAITLKGPMTSGEITRALQHRLRARDLKEVLEALEASGEVEVTARPTGGRPVKVYEVKS